MNKIISLFYFLFSSIIVYTQVYCPYEDGFIGAVSAIESAFYSNNIENNLGFPFYYTPSEKDSLIHRETSFVKIVSGRIMEEIILNPSGRLYCKCKSRYSAEGDEIEFTTFDSDDKIDVKKIFTYDNRQLVKTEYFDQENKLFSTSVYQIDSTSRTRMSMQVLDNNTFENVILSELNNDYLPLRVYSIQENKNRILIGTTEYDSLNRIKIEVDWNFDKSRYDHIEYYYDTLNRVIGGQRFDSRGILIGTESIKYDKNSNIIYSHIYESYENKWKTYSFEYRYDNQNNWLTKTTWIGEGDNRILIQREERKITYR